MPTARTRHVLGTSLQQLDRYQEAIEPLEDCIELRPQRHAPLQNLGNCYWRLGKDDNCPACVARRAAWSPLRIRGGRLVV